jgi:hypothetical protein
MKKIYLNEKEKKNMLNKFVEQFKKQIDEYMFSLTDKSFTVKTELGEVAKDKVVILYTQEAYLRMKALVNYFSTEVAWYGLVDKLDDKTYHVYDVKMCKQYVNGAKVDTEDDDAVEFFDSLTDDELNHMHFQAHSHVNMSTGASAVDIQNQNDVVRNMGKKGFYIFQIWNKKDEISTYLYDLDNNTYYDSKDVIVEVEDSMGTLDDFLAEAEEKVIEKKSYPYQWQYQKSGKKSDKFENMPDDYPYYGGYNY